VGKGTWGNGDEGGKKSGGWKEVTNLFGERDLPCSRARMAKEHEIFEAESRRKGARQNLR